MKKQICFVAICLMLTAGQVCAQRQTGKARRGKQPSKSFKAPASVKVVRDIVYATYGERKVMLDLYLPKYKKAPAGKIPCIMTIHGGGYRLGDKNIAPFLLMHSRGDRIVVYKHSTILREKLTQAGVPVQLMTIVRGGHAFWNGNTPKAAKTMADTISFFRKTLKHPKPQPATKPAEKSN